MNGLRGFIVTICWLAIVLLEPAVVLAGEAAAAPQDSMRTAPAGKSAEADAACEHSDTGSCCIPGQENALPPPKPETAAPADCPPQHAKQAGQDS